MINLTIRVPRATFVYPQVLSSFDLAPGGGKKLTDHNPLSSLLHFPQSPTGRREQFRRIILEFIRQ